MEFINDEIGELRDDETLETYYDKAADLAQAMHELHLNNEIKHPSVRAKVSKVIESITEQWVESTYTQFEKRKWNIEELKNNGIDNKTELYERIKRACEDLVEYLSILIKLEA
ncbi:MAG: hypothetical protein IIX47_00410 [Spirochaetaceae bacterium]|nr:hypothetical protein [Spirochaetaceae bacterium]